MSGTSEILQEYLVKLGYQVDALSNAKFDSYLSKTTKNILSTGGAVVGLAASIEAAAAAFAYSMRKMYFQSELSQSTVKNINAMTFAGKQIGIEGEAMGNAIHSMAQAMRLNPGLQALVESFGVKVTGRDMSDVMVDFVKALRQMPEFAATKYAALFGIDPDTYHQMINHMDELAAKRQQLLNLYKQTGVDPDAAKKAILEYTASIDLLEARLSILGQAVLIRLQPFFKKTTEFINQSISGWTDIVTNKNQIILDSFTGKAALGFVKETLATATDPITNYLKELNDKSYEWATKNFSPRGIRNNNPGNLNYAGQAGASKEPGKDGRFAVFKNMVDGNAALADQLNRYSMSGVDTIEKIISKYAPKEDKNNTQAYIDRVAKQLGVKSTDTLNFANNPELMKKVMQAIIGVENGAKWVNQKDIQAGINQSKYGQALNGSANTRLGIGAAGARVIHVSFAPNITVHSSDPAAAGRAVATAQERLYGDVLRNTKSALQ